MASFDLTQDLDPATYDLDDLRSTCIYQKFCERFRWATEAREISLEDVKRSIQLLRGDDPRFFYLTIQEFGFVLRVRCVMEMDAAVRDNELMKMLELCDSTHAAELNGTRRYRYTRLCSSNTQASNQCFISTRYRGNTSRSRRIDRNTDKKQ